MIESIGDPYRDLLLAIIDRAIDDCKYKRKQIRNGKDWLHETINDPEYYLFEDKSENLPSFISICQIFDCDPEYLRDQIKKELLHEAPYYKSSIEKLRDKIKRNGSVSRTDLLRFAWHKVGKMRREALDLLLLELLRNGEIYERIERRYDGPGGKNGRWYYWNNDR